MGMFHPPGKLFTMAAHPHSVQDREVQAGNCGASQSDATGCTHPHRRRMTHLENQKQAHEL